MDLIKAKRDRSIEVKQLDVEAVELASLIGGWGEESAECRYQKEALELSLERLESELSLNIRSRPSDYGLGDKPTEGAIKAALKLQPKFQKLEDEIREVTREYWHYENHMKALEVKRRMLEYLGDLHGRLYFAGPKIPRDLLKEVEICRKINSASATDLQAKGLKKRPIPQRP